MTFLILAKTPNCENTEGVISSLKIAVNTRFLLKNQLEGIGRFTLETFRRLAATHPEHEFIFFFDRPFDASYIFSSNVTPVVLFPPARHPFLFIWWFEWSIARALKKYQADVFISPDNFLSLSTSTPTLLVVHDIAFTHFIDNDKFINRLYYKYFMPRFLKRANRIVTVSEFTKQDIINYYKINASKIDVCYNGCREEFKPISSNEKEEFLKKFVIARDEATEGSPYFLYVGAVHPRKNVHRMIEAFDTFKKQNNTPFKLMICGRFAWQTGEVKAAFDKADFKKDIIFTGYVSDEDVVRLTAAAQAFVYVSNFEGFGIPILEAMHCDVPVITSNTSSMPEVAGDAALLVNPESVEEITNALSQLAFDKNLRQHLIEKGRIQRTKFSWEKTAIIIYDNILKTFQDEKHSK